MAEPDSPSLHNRSPSVNEHPIRSLLDDVRSPLNDSGVSLNGSPSLPSLDFSPLAPSSKRLHIANIPFRWTEAELDQLFSPFGAISNVEVVRNDRGSKGYGFVTFLDATAADQAIAGLSCREFQGRTIMVNEASRRRRPLPEQQRGGAVWQPATGQSGQQCSADFGALLLKQKQLLAQQQLQQFLVTQQQSDMIATALGLPTSNLGGLLAGQLQYPAAAAMPGLTMDPLALQLQSLKQQHQQLLQPGLLPQQYAAYGQMPTVANYPMPQQSLGAGIVKTEMTPQLQQLQQLQPPTNQQVAMYIANEMTHSSSATRGRGSTSSTSLNGSSQRFTPY